MCKIYKDTPDNFTDIEPYVVTKVEDAVKVIVQSGKCYFYDTCAFRRHMRVSDPKPIFDYIQQTGGVIIITRCIIMELCSNDNKLWSEHIEYIKKINLYGISVLVIYEEDIMSVLNACYSGISEVNRMLSFAVKNAKSKTGTKENVLNSDSVLKKRLLIDDKNSESSLAVEFFEKVRANKTSEDNLGEELIAICVHLLSNIIEMTSFKYIVLSDDKGAITLLSKTMQNVERHIGKKCIWAVTTEKLCWLMLEKNVISSKDQVEDILKPGNTGESIKVYCSEEFELVASEKTMKIEELSEKLTNNSGIKIYF